jgi:hypothetical protein
MYIKQSIDQISHRIVPNYLWVVNYASLLEVSHERFPFIGWIVFEQRVSACGRIRASTREIRHVLSKYRFEVSLQETLLFKQNSCLLNNVLGLTRVGWQMD